MSAEESDIESGNSEEAEDREELNIASDQFMLENMYGEMGGVLHDGEEEELRRRGRRTDKEARLRSAGTSLRTFLKDKIWQAGLRRPKAIKFRNNGVRDRHHRVVEM